VQKIKGKKMAQGFRRCKLNLGCIVSELMWGFVVGTQIVQFISGV
jgi:hypothetical protein